MKLRGIKMPNSIERQLRDEIDTLTAALRCINAMLNQPVQFSNVSDGDEYKDKMSRMACIKILRGDCESVRRFIEKTLEPYAMGE